MDNVSDPRPVEAAWESGTHDAHRSFVIVVKPLNEYLTGTKWSRQLLALDPNSVDITSPLWGPFYYEVRILDFRVPDDWKRGVAEYWTEQEDKLSKILNTIRNSLTSFSTIGSMPPTVEDLGYLDLTGGWVLDEDSAALHEGLEDNVVDKKSRKWAGILGWRDESCERKAWAEDGAGPGQECLQSLISISGEVAQRWHATIFEVSGNGNQRYAFSSSDDDNDDDDF